MKLGGGASPRRDEEQNTLPAAMTLLVLLRLNKDGPFGAKSARR